MKHLLLLVYLMSSLFTTLACVEKNTAASFRPDAGGNTVNHPLQTGNKMKITIGASIFTATLLDTPAANAFKSMLPLTIDMVELNGNEKYADLRKSLPTHAFNPKTIQNGDLMLYGASTLVLFYKSFPTSYTYTKLGSLDDATGLAAALGSGNVTVTYELE